MTTNLVALASRALARCAHQTADQRAQMAEHYAARAIELAAAGRDTAFALHMAAALSA